MLVELTVNWAYASTPVVPFPARIYWRLKGNTSYSIQDVGDGTTTTITTINDSSTTLTTACSLEYEGYVIPLCFVDTATDCAPFLYDRDTGLESPNPSCPTTDRSYWDATIDATNNQSCRGVTVSCTKSGVYAIHAVDPDLMSAQTYTNDGFPTIVATGGGSGFGFGAMINASAYDDVNCVITKDCWIVTQGSNYNTPPTVKIAASDDGIEIPMIVTMACNDFLYSGCKVAQGTLKSGEILLGESKVVCMTNEEYDKFTPSATNSVFEDSLGGCCTGNGKKYTLTFTSPNPVLYPTVYYTYTVATTSDQGQSVEPLYHGVPYQTSNCCVDGSVTAYGITPNVACSTDFETNIWLFNNHVTVVPFADC